MHKWYWLQTFMKLVQLFSKITKLLSNMLHLAMPVEWVWTCLVWNMILWVTCHLLYESNMSIIQDKRLGANKANIHWHSLMVDKSTQCVGNNLTYCQQFELANFALHVWSYYISWANSIITPCTSISNTSCKKLKVVLELEIQSHRGHK